MKRSRELIRKILTVAFPAFVLFVAYETYVYFIRSGEIASGITRAGLLSIEPGETEGDVRRVLGRPLREQVYQQNQNIPGFPDKSLIYGQPNALGKGLEIYVNILNGLVDNVALEEHDLGIYWYNRTDGRVMKDEAAFKSYIKK